MGIAHKANHPLSGTPPNVFVHPLDLQAGEHVELSAQLPVVHFRPPAEGEPAKQTAVLVASRDIEDEEVFETVRASFGVIARESGKLSEDDERSDSPEP